VGIAKKVLFVVVVVAAIAWAVKTVPGVKKVIPLGSAA
jgi:hypothetical protein